MSIRHLRRVLIVCLLSAGCGRSTQFGAPPPSVARPPTEQPSAPEATAEQPASEAEASDAAALARKVESHAQQLEQALAQPAPQVQWTTPEPSPQPAAPAPDVPPVVAADAPPAVQVASIEAPPAPQVLVAAPPASAEPLARRLVARAEQRPHDAVAVLEQQMLEFLEMRPTPQPQALGRLQADDREVVAAAMDALSNLRAVLLSDPDAPLSRKTRPLLDAAERLRGMSELRVASVAAARQVTSFGNYEAMPASFPAGREGVFILYCEVASFTSKPDSQGAWQTRLAQDLALYDASGRRVWADKTDEIVDQCRSRRSDFFIARKVRLPATLAAGTYTLKVSVVDRQAGRLAEATLPLTVGAP